MRLTRAWPQGGHEVELLEAGAQYFPALLAAIAAAQHEIWFETYIFAADPTGMKVAQALGAAAQRGARVCVMVDGFGTRVLPAVLAQAWAQAGVTVRVYAPVPRLVSLDRQRLRRLHRKQVCIDAELAFVGGINVLDDLWDPNHGALDHPRLDYAVRVRGPLVTSVRASMMQLWRHGERPGLAFWESRGRPGAEDWMGAATPPAARLNLRQPVRALHILRDNWVHRRAIERAYLKAIGSARREVLIANAYFLPGRRFRRALLEAARRGVRVCLLLQGRAEYALPRLAEQSLYGQLLPAGVEIVEYHRSFLHAKVAVIDDWATVGSSNIDPFSLLLSREANVVVLDRAFAARLRERVLVSMAEGGRPVVPHDYARRSWWARWRGWCAYHLVRLGVRVSAGARHW